VPTACANPAEAPAPHVTRKKESVLSVSVLPRKRMGDEQHLRFLSRIRDPLKQWKLSPMDLESRRRWEQYTKAKEAMIERTHIAEAPWWIVQAVDKKRARLNCIAHLLEQMPYTEVPKPQVELPPRVRNPDYTRQPVPAEMFVPERY